MGNPFSKQSKSNQSASLLNSAPSRCVLNDESIDQFTLIWLDGAALKDSLDSLRTKTLLRQLNNNHCLFFDDVKLFLLELERLKNTDHKILLIVSGFFAEEILSQTRDTIAAIIIFCRRLTKYNHLMKDYSNIIEICTEHEVLKNSIQRELPSLKLNLFINQKLNSLRSLNSTQITRNSSAYFSYMLFIDFLKQMPQSKQAKDIMLTKCKDQYRKNERELERIDLFRDTYTSETAIDWHIKDCFIYRLVNQAFRSEDITLWYLFRFYIKDLCTQLENIHQQQNTQSFLRLYRGQYRLPTKELENLRSNIDGLISTNGFFSTSKSIDIAKAFIKDAAGTEYFKVVLFEITVDARHLKKVIFVDIDKYTERLHECEVLFNIGSVFQVQSVNFDFDLNAWKVQMKATDEGTDSITERIQSMKQKYQNGNINLLFGRLLLDMAQYTKAESYFQMMLNVLPKTHPDRASVYEYIGDLNMRTTNWNEALKHFNAAYEIKKKKLPSNHQDIAMTLNNLGNYYKAIRNNQKALEYYSEALTCETHAYNRAVSLLNISAIYVIEKDYRQAFDVCIKARHIIQEMPPNNCIAIIQCHTIIGNVYLAQKNYDSAKDFYLAAFEMSKKTLFTDDYYQVVCIKALANLYHKQNTKQQAIEFCLEQLNIYEEYLTKNHFNVAYLLMTIAELYEDNEEERIEFVERAAQILQENIHLQYYATANCFKMAGDFSGRALDNK